MKSVSVHGRESGIRWSLRTLVKSPSPGLSQLFKYSELLKPQVSQSVFRAEMVQPSDHLHGFLGTPMVPLSSYVGLPRVTHSTRGGDLEKQIRGRITFLTLLAMLTLIQTGAYFVLGCSITLLSHVKVLIQQHSQELLLTIALNPFYIQFVLYLEFP